MLTLWGDAFTPASVASLLFARDPGAGLVFQDAALTTPAGDGEPVGGRLPHYGTGTETQSTLAARLTLRTGPNRLTTAGAGFLTYPAVTLSGPFTLYAVGSRAAGTKWVPAAGSTALYFIQFNNTVQANNDIGTTVSKAYTGAAGTILARWRRDAADVVYFAAAGMAEVALGTLPGDVTFTECGASTAMSTYTAAGNDHRAEELYAADLVATGEDAAVRAYLLALTGASL